jgi:tryptophan halogenase
MLWRTQTPGLYETNQRFELFSSASKQYVLYGMGLSDIQVHANQKETLAIKRLRNETLSMTEKLLSALPSNRQFLAGIRK